MAKIKAVEFAQEPVWFGSRILDAETARVELALEGQVLHLRVGRTETVTGPDGKPVTRVLDNPRLRGRIGAHCAFAPGYWARVEYEDEPPRDIKK